jgi:hypothetical protein
MDHDQRFKALIRDFFPDFLRLFFPEISDRLDLSTVEWLDTEILPDPPEGSRHLLDMVARVQAIPESNQPPEDMLALVHLEIESSDKTTLIKPRLPAYFLHLRNRYQIPIMPIVLYLRVGMDGIGVDNVEIAFFGRPIMRFSYYYVGLPALDALQYLERDNWLGIALTALMNMPREQVPWIGAEALRKLSEAPLNEQQKFLLSDCVEAYLPLDEAGQKLFQQITHSENYARLNAMNKTTYDRGMEQGIEKGIEKGLEKGLEKGIERGVEKERLRILRVAEALLRQKFGLISSKALTELKQLNSEQLEELLVSMESAQTLADLGLSGT